MRKTLATRVLNELQYCGLCALNFIVAVSDCANLMLRQSVVVNHKVAPTCFVNYRKHSPVFGD